MSGYVIQSIIKLHTVFSELNKFNASLNINIQITIHMSVVFRGTVVTCWSQLTANHPAVVSSKPTK